MKKFASIAALHRHYINSCKCSLAKSATRPVPGNGNPKAKVVFIGEAPGKDEDISGMPFVGRAGKSLDQMLASIKMKREDVYITNTVKYRPPENRDPLPEEKSACRDWLQAELYFIKPKLIVFLGRHSMNDFFPELKISEAHGKLIHARINGLKTEYFLPLYHPSSAMYNGSLRNTLAKDFKKIPVIMKKL